MRFSIQAGPAVSFFMADREHFVQNTDLTNARLIQRVPGSHPAKQPNWQIWAGIHVDWKFNENFDLYIEPTYKYYFNPLTGNESTPEQAPWAVGLGVGVRYNFGYNTLRP